MSTFLSIYLSHSLSLYIYIYYLDSVRLVTFRLDQSEISVMVVWSGLVVVLY